MTSNLNYDYTKIVATIGPTSDTPEILEQLIAAGLNVARLNTKHGTPEWHAERIDRIHAAAKATGQPISILLDLQGPEIRIDVPDKQPFTVEKDGQLEIVSEFTDNPHQFKVPAQVIAALNMGDHVLIEDGVGEFEIVEKLSDKLIVKAMSKITVKDRKTMNTPGVVIDMPSLIDADLEKLDMINEHSVDFVALSFVRDKKDLDVLKQELKKRKVSPFIIAKIENQAAIDNIDEIIDNSDGIMIARGDLAVEIPMEELAYRQKNIIKLCRSAGIPVITATQMLKSMVDSPRPTRAEVTDVANAVFDGTDAIMLSEETAMGNYPVESVATMRKIAHYNEIHTHLLAMEDGDKTRTSAVTKMAMSLINDDLETIDRIVVLTETGFSAQQLIRHRPKAPVIAVTDNIETVKKCALMYAVTPVLHEFPRGRVEDLKKIIDHLIEQDLVKKGEKLLVIRGTFFGDPGHTNTVTVLDVE